jgi:hypothetical protein
VDQRVGLEKNLRVEGARGLVVRAGVKDEQLVVLHFEAHDSGAHRPGGSAFHRSGEVLAKVGGQEPFLPEGRLVDRQIEVAVGVDPRLAGARLSEGALPNVDHLGVFLPRNGKETLTGGQ